MDWASLSNFVEHQLDSKLRLAVPSAWRPKEGAIHLRPKKQPDGSVILRGFYEHYRNAKIEEIKGLAQFAAAPARREDAIQQFTNLTHPREINSQGKLVLPEALVDAARLPLPGKVVLLWTPDYFFDIMSRETFEAISRARAQQEEDFSHLF